MLFIGSFLEIVSIGIIVPFINIVNKPSILLKKPLIGTILSTLSINKPLQIIVMASMALIFIFIIRSFYLVIQWRILYRFIYDYMVNLGKKLLAVYLNAPYSFHLQSNASILISNINIEVLNIAGVLRMLMSIIAESIILIGLLAILFISAPLATGSGIFLLGSISMVYLLSIKKQIKKFGKIRKECQGEMIKRVKESIGAVKEVKILGKEDYFVQAFYKTGLDFAKALHKNMLLGVYPRLLLETMAGISFVLLVLIIILSKGDIQDALPLLALFGAAIIRLVPSISRMASSISRLQFFAPSINTVYNDLKKFYKGEYYQEQSKLPTIRFKNKIEIKEIGFSYPNAMSPAIENLTITINRGQSIGIVGQSGSGKTTFINLLLGLLKPTHGKILVDGIDIQKNIHGWQQNIGYVPQDIYLLDDTIRKNVAFGVPDEDIDDNAIWSALELAQLSSFVKAKEKGLDTVIGEHGVSLSGGQRQRLGIARALYHNPQVLVLDEATSSLDYKTEKRLTKAIESLSMTKTLVIVTHRINTVKHCDIIYILKAGKVVGAGRYEDLRESNLVFQQLLFASKDLDTEETTG